LYYMFANIIILNVYVYFMQKRLPRIYYYATVIFALTFEETVNIYLDLKLDLYGFFRHGIDWEYLFIMVGIIPQANMIFINYYPFAGGAFRKVRYILISAILFTIWEWITSFTWVFYYNGWKPWHSLLCYPVILWIMVLNAQYARHLLKRAALD
jgi:hypothetical protein